MTASCSKNHRFWGVKLAFSAPNPLISPPPLFMNAAIAVYVLGYLSNWLILAVEPAGAVTPLRVGTSWWMEGDCLFGIWAPLSWEIEGWSVFHVCVGSGLSARLTQWRSISTQTLDWRFNYKDSQRTGQIQDGKPISDLGFELSLGPLLAVIWTQQPPVIWSICGWPSPRIILPEPISRMQSSALNSKQ